MRVTQTLVKCTLVSLAVATANIPEVRLWFAVELAIDPTAIHESIPILFIVVADIEIERGTTLIIINAELLARDHDSSDGCDVIIFPVSNCCCLRQNQSLKSRFLIVPTMRYFSSLLP